MGMMGMFDIGEDFSTVDVTVNPLGVEATRVVVQGWYL